MRQTLLQISLGSPFTFWTRDPATGWPEVGVFWVWLAVAAGFLIFETWQRRKAGESVPRSTLVWLAASGLVAAFANRFFPPRSIPVFGYGFLVMLGFMGAVLLAQRHLRKIGLPKEIAWDAGMWILVGGIGGGRLFYILQYHSLVYSRSVTFGDYLKATVDLTAGGLVLIGAMFGGGLAFALFSKLRKHSLLDLADAFTPSIFLGVGFGRLGCLLNGCCYGDRCELPWGISFPSGSIPFEALKYRGFVSPDAPATMPLHPTQIYSSIDGFVLCLITMLLFAERRWRGEVFGWGCVLYSITRFLMEFLRGDEMGQLGTSLTISQLYSLGIASIGLIILYWNRSSRLTTNTSTTA